MASDGYVGVFIFSCPTLTVVGMSEFNEKSDDTTQPGSYGVPDVGLVADSEDATQSSTATGMRQEPVSLAFGMVHKDPLTVRPRRSSIVICACLGVAALILSACLWLFAVRTVTGQEYDDMVWSHFSQILPSWFIGVLSIFVKTYVDIAVVVVFSLVAVIVNVVRRRWLLLVQLAVFGMLCFAVAATVKRVLPRPFLVNVASYKSNSAPSGHTLMAAAGAVVLICAVPRVWRAVAALIGWAFTLLVALSVVQAQWHRPSDPIMSMLIVAGLAFIMLAFTRASGMDEPGTRMSSASIQIVATVMITAGIVAVLYGGYVFWQIEPGLDLSAQWARSGACAAAFALMLGVSLVTFGTVAALRQLTASPLSKLGLIGAPPEPPKPSEERND